MSRQSTSTSLCPGYKHVEQFGPNEDYEKEEEVSYVTFDLGNIEPILVPSSSTYRLIDLDTPTPYLQLSGTILKGRHDSLLGTELLFAASKIYIFDNDSSPLTLACLEPQDRNRRSIVHVSSTEQRITFKEVQLQFKGQETTGSQCTDVIQAAGPYTAAKAKEGIDMGLNLLGQI